MGADITTTRYERVKIDLLKKLSDQQAAKGPEHAQFYEIWVDEMKVVPRTNDPKEFDSFEEYVTEDTQKIKVQMYYTPNSPRNKTHVFLMKDNQPIHAAQTLSGVDIDARISEKVSVERERWDALAVKKELDETKQKLEEAEQYIDLLQGEIEKNKTKKLHIGEVNLGELASVMLEGIIRRNPKIIAKLPGGAALAGVFEQDNKERETDSTTETEASFERKPDSEPELTQEERAFIEAIKQMEQKIGTDQLMKVMQIIECLTNDPSQINPVAELLNIKTTNAK